MSDSLTIPILLNSTHYVSGTKSTYQYSFPNNIEFNHGDTCSLTSLSMYNSIFNISAEAGNNKLNIIYGPDVIALTLPDGLYGINDIDSYIQHFAISNNLYLVDNFGRNVYYISISVNPSRYRVQVITSPIPATLPTDWTNPSGGAGSGIQVFAGSTPRIQFLDNGLQKITGFVPGIYPPAASAVNYSVVGQNIPQVNPVQALLVKCNLISNMMYSNPTDLLAIFTIPSSARSGEIVEYEPNDYSFIDIHPGKYEYIRISLVDQIFEQVDIIDRDLTIMLLLNIKKK